MTSKENGSKRKKKFKDSWAEMRFHPVLYTDLCVGTDSDRMQMLFNLFLSKFIDLWRKCVWHYNSSRALLIKLLLTVKMIGLEGQYFLNSRTVFLQLVSADSDTLIVPRCYYDLFLFFSVENDQTSSAYWITPHLSGIVYCRPLDDDIKPPPEFLDMSNDRLHSILPSAISREFIFSLV